MSAITAQTSACGGQALIVGTADGLVISLVAQRKAPPSTKTEIQPSYIATQHARKVNCVAATPNTFATAGDDCTIVVSQIGCLFGGDAATRTGKQHYRITGAHALPITCLAYAPSDETLLVSASKDGTVVMHRLHFVASGVAAAGSALACVPLAQSIDRLVRLPFQALAIAPITPADGTLFAVAGTVEGGDSSIKVAVVDFSVAQRDGNGTGRPLKPYVVLPSDEAMKATDATKLYTADGKLVLSNGVSGIQWDMTEMLKAIAIGRPDEEIKYAALEEEDESAATADESAAAFVGTAEQVKNAINLITSPTAKANPYYASIYANFCWSIWARPAACAAVAKAANSGKKGAAEGSDSDAEDNASAPGFGKRARKTMARQARAEAEAADWSRVSLAIDSLAEVEHAKVVGIPLRYTQLLTAKSLTVNESPYAYAPLSNSACVSTAAVAPADEEEAFVTAAVASQKAKNAIIQASIDALYAALSTAAGKKTGRDEAASPKGRASKRHTAEKDASPKGGKSVISLT